MCSSVSLQNSIKMKEFQVKFRLALSMVRGVGLSTFKKLVSEFGDEESVMKAPAKALISVAGVGDSVVNQIKNPKLIEKAERELEFLYKSGANVLFFDDSDFPYRLKECCDHPILLYSRGRIRTDVRRVIGVVGTRKMTPYGKSFCEEVLADLAKKYPDILVVSGLAYGVDACAHRKALDLGLQTIGVVGHGLDMIYPAVHRELSQRMTENGGLLTEFHTNSLVDRKNFVSRNRIIAGLSDVVLIVESGEKGGALLTAEFANSYNREVCALPGRVGDVFSVGCNNLVKKNAAAMVESALDIECLMNWDTHENRSQHLMYELFPEFTPEQQVVIDYLKRNGKSQINQMTRELKFPYSKLSSMLFEMEMQDWVISFPGGVYDLR